MSRLLNKKILFFASFLIIFLKTNFPASANAQTLNTNVSCKGLYLDKSTITLGQTITLSGIVSNYGIIKYAKVNTTSETLSPNVSAAVLATLAKGFGTIKTTFKPTQTGWYVFEVFAFDSTSCKIMCSPDGVTLKNTFPSGGSCDTFSHWQQTGFCNSNGCIKWVEVRATNSTPDISKCSVVSTGYNCDSTVPCPVRLWVMVGCEWVTSNSFTLQKCESNGSKYHYEGFKITCPDLQTAKQYCWASPNVDRSGKPVVYSGSWKNSCSSNNTCAKVTNVSGGNFSMCNDQCNATCY